jgi:uncharacterized protein (TIGR02186 family)
VRRIALALLALPPWSGMAGAETLVTTLSSPLVAITSNYTGTQVVAFGAVERDAQTVARADGYDVVVTVRGPPQAMVVREKEPFGPIWINRQQQKFVQAPAFLSVLASRPLREITSGPLRRRLRVGLEAIVDAPGMTFDRGLADDPFRRALMRLKGREHLYVERERAVNFLTPTLFRVPITLPATAPPGPYTVEFALFVGGVILTRQENRFELVKSGFEQDVADIARDHATLYGLLTAAVSLAFGWIASVIFRRD